MIPASIVFLVFACFYVKALQIIPISRSANLNISRLRQDWGVTVQLPPDVELY